MSKILLLESSPQNEKSVSRTLSALIIENLKLNDQKSSVKARDLSVDQPPHVSQAFIKSVFTPPDKRTATDLAAIHYSEDAVRELFESDNIVISVPFYNFSIPSTLKAWIDQICRPKVTFVYGESGPMGLVTGKKVYLAISSGGVYTEGPMKAYDFTENYLRAVLGFLGMTDITVIRVEGVAMPGFELEGALKNAMTSFKY